jgi:integrase/predicted nucleic acid-binding Zn ribbon protein
LSSSTSTTAAVSSFSPSPLLDRRIEETTAGLLPSFAKQLLSIGEDNANIETIVKYIAAIKSEVNLSDNYRQCLIALLSRFSKYNDNKPFRDLTRSDVIAFLDTYRKTETQDPMHKWIGTYNLFLIYLLRFFKWLYYPDIEPGKRPKPSVVENLPQLRRKEKSIYKPTDLWTQQDDLLFLRYCPSSRDRLYHSLSRDTSCRPDEILKLKIRDITFKIANNYQYAEALVNGKTGSRPILLIDSIPYLKDYLDHEHPQPRNPNSPLLCGTGKVLGRHVKPNTIYKIYDQYKKQTFPKLLESPNVLPEDKQKIRDLLKKPWNPYIRRHSALTEKARILKDPILKMHAGWSQSSQMHLKYEHWFGNEPNEELLSAYGIVSGDQQVDQLHPKQCPNCSEPNKPDSKFCSKCRMVLTYDAYSETLENQKQKEDRLTVIENQMKALLNVFGENKDQNQVNQMAETLYISGILKEDNKKHFQK